MYSDDQIFVWDMESLKELVKRPTPRNLLDASATLRRLLTDGSVPLIHKVSRNRGYKALFPVIGSGGISPTLKAIVDNPDVTFVALNPEPGHDSVTTYLPLDAFLREPMYYFADTFITAKQILSYVANVGGGVHQGSPKQKDNAALIHETANSYLIGDEPYPVESVGPLVRIVKKALWPLYERIRTEINA